MLLKRILPTGLLKNKAVQVINWTKYLNLGLNGTLSSHKPTRAKGKHNKIEKLWKNIIPKDPIITNPIPPAVGILNSCELLKFGLYIKFFLRKGNISFKKQKVIVAVMKTNKIKKY